MPEWLEKLRAKPEASRRKLALLLALGLTLFAGFTYLFVATPKTPTTDSTDSDPNLDEEIKKEILGPFSAIRSGVADLKEFFKADLATSSDSELGDLPDSSEVQSD